MRLFVNKYPHNIIENVGMDAYKQNFGFLTIPNAMSPFYAPLLGVPWAMDNFAFSNFQPVKFITMLKRYQNIPGCKFAAVPDVWGDAEATMRRWKRWSGCVRQYGYPLALVAQDGIEKMPIPWDEFDALFIGGTTEWKFSPHVSRLVFEARTRGKWTHMGRVNTATRIRYCQDLGFDSCDGSSYATHLHKVVTHLPYLETRQMALGLAF